MPTYDYVCRACEHRFEHFQSMQDPTLRKCPECGRLKLERLIGAGAGILFKGSGFYETDYKRKSGGPAPGDSDGSSQSKGDAKAEPKADSKAETKADSKADSKAETKSDSKGGNKSETRSDAKGGGKDNASGGPSKPPSKGRKES